MPGNRLAILSCRDHKPLVLVAVAAAMPGPTPKPVLPIVRLAEDDHDGAYDGMPRGYAAAA